MFQKPQIRFKWMPLFFEQPVTAWVPRCGPTQETAQLGRNCVKWGLQLFPCVFRDMLTFSLFAQIFAGVNEFCPLDKTCHPFLWETVASQSPVWFLQWNTHQEHLMAGLSPSFFLSFFLFLLFNYSLHFLPNPPPHPSQTHLPPPPPSSPIGFVHVSSTVLPENPSLPTIPSPLPSGYC